MENIEKIVEQLEFKNLLLNGKEEEIINYFENHPEKIENAKSIINFQNKFPLLAINQLPKLESVFDTLLQRKTLKEQEYEKMLQSMKEVAIENQKKQYSKDWRQATYSFESDLGVRMPLRGKTSYEQRIADLTKTGQEFLSVVKNNDTQNSICHFAGNLNYLYFINYAIRNYPSLADFDLWDEFWFLCELWRLSTKYYKDNESTIAHPSKMHVKVYPKLLKITRNNIRLANQTIENREQQLKKTLVYKNYSSN